jgi:hypothetical protein
MKEHHLVTSQLPLAFRAPVPTLPNDTAAGSHQNLLSIFLWLALAISGTKVFPNA